MTSHPVGHVTGSNQKTPTMFTLSEGRPVSDDSRCALGLLVLHTATIFG